MRLAHSSEGRIGADYYSIEIESNTDRFFLTASFCVLLRLNFFSVTNRLSRDLESQTRSSELWIDL